MTFKYSKLLKSKNLVFLIAFLFLACEEDVREVTLYDKGMTEANASRTSLPFGESVDFSSTSTKVATTNWTFAGGNPGTSINPNVTVIYAVPGTFEAELVVKYIDNTIEVVKFTITVEGPDEPLPFSGTPAPIPGTIEAENYDLGGEGLAYHDTEPENLAVAAGSPTYRDDDGIDIEVGATITNIGYSNADEWVNYTVNVAQAGGYDFEFILASGSTTGGSSLIIQKLDIISGTTTNLAETGAFANTGGWGVYTSFMVEGVALPAGVSTLRIYYTGGGVNFDKVNVTQGSAPIQKFGIYTETSNTAGEIGVTIQNNNMVNIATVNTGAYEGNEAYYFQFVHNPAGYGLHATLNADPQPFDASAYADGFYNVAIKTTCPGKVKIRVRDASNGNFWVMLDDAVQTYGLLRDGQWHTLKIPMADFLSDGGASPDLTTLSNVFVLRSDEASATPAAGEDWDFYVDDIYLSLE